MQGGGGVWRGYREGEGGVEGGRGGGREGERIDVCTRSRHSNMMPQG